MHVAGFHPQGLIAQGGVGVLCLVLIAVKVYTWQTTWYCQCCVMGSPPALAGCGSFAGSFLEYYAADISKSANSAKAGLASWPSRSGSLSDLWTACAMGSAS